MPRLGLLLVAALFLATPLLAQRTHTRFPARPDQAHPRLTSQTGAEVACSGGTANGFPCQNVDLVAHLTIRDLGGTSSTDLNDIWGWTDPSTGNEYALVGLSDGTAFVDISDPENPVYLGELLTHTSSSLWRDLKVYGNHVYIVSEASNHGMQVFDLTQLRNVTNPPVRFSETAHYDRFGSAHNIVINEDTGFAYAVGAGGGQSCSAGLHMMDLRNPTAPQFAGCFSNDGYTHDAQCVLYDGPDTEHQGKEICVASNEDTITLVDVTDKARPVMISRTGYPQSGYVHQGWLTEDHRYFLLDDELDEFSSANRTLTRIWDFEDLDDPQLIVEYDGVATSIDHNQYIVGDYAYQANYTSGLRILDISDITRPQEVGFFDTVPTNDNKSFLGAWSNYPFFESGVLIVSSIDEGLFILRPHLDAAPPTAALTVELVPLTNPVEVGANGGTIEFDIVLTNTTDAPQQQDIWTVITLPNSRERQIVGPVRPTFQAGQVFRRTLTQRIPGGAPTGGYIYAAFVGSHPDGAASVDTFAFSKTNNAPSRNAAVLTWDTDLAAQLLNTSTATDDAPTVPAAFALEASYPNPFNPTTTIPYHLSEPATVTLRVYNLLGQAVRTLVAAEQPAGSYTVTWDAADDGGQVLPSGTYLFRLEAGSFSATQSVVLLK